MMVRPPGLPRGQNALWDWMERRSLTQRQLADKLDIHWTYVNHILSNRRSPGLATAIRIERVTGIPVEEWDSTQVDKPELVASGKGRKRQY